MDSRPKPIQRTSWSEWSFFDSAASVTLGSLPSLDRSQHFRSRGALSPTRTAHCCHSLVRPVLRPNRPFVQSAAFCRKNVGVRDEAAVRRNRSDGRIHARSQVFRSRQRRGPTMKTNI